MHVPLPQDKKLTVRCRVEPGCLGPAGGELIEEFCNHAQIQIEHIDADFVHWQIIPRHDKSLAEIEYTINNKTITRNQAAIYLDKFSRNLDDFEEFFHEILIELIAEYTNN